LWCLVLVTRKNYVMGHKLPERLSKFVLMSKYTKASQSLTLKLGMEMPGDHSLEYRASAGACLRLAANATNSGTRTALLMMAQRYMELAGDRSSGALWGDALLPQANDQQTHKP
jgi:hypothetical protein